jgi:tetratricopeptide (TPR) repeat protein
MQKDMQEKFQQNKVLLLFAVISALNLFTYPADAQTPDAAYLQGCAGLMKGNYKDAVDKFSIVITYNNSDEQIFIKRGQSLLALDELDAAIADFEEANLILPDVADIWLARTYAVKGENTTSLNFLKDHLNSLYRLPEDSIIKDPAFDKLQLTTAWQVLWQEDWYTPEEKVAAEASYYAKKKNFSEAIALLNGELYKDPDNMMLIAIRAKYYFNLGNYLEAIADYASLIKMDKSNVKYYEGRGLALLNAEKYKDAVNDFNKVLKSDPADFKVYLLRAQAYAGSKMWYEAVKDVQFYLGYFETDQDAQYECGEYCYNAQDYINALKYFNRNIKDDPNNSKYYKARGKTYLKTAVYRYAYSDLSMSLDLNPADSETWMLLGLVKHETGEHESCCSDLKKAQSMGNTEVLKYIVEYCEK